MNYSLDRDNGKADSAWISEPSDVAMDASESWDISFTWSYSEKWTFRGLTFPSSDSESLLLLLVSSNSKLGFFNRDFNGVVLEFGWALGFSSGIIFSTFVITSSVSSLRSSSSPVVGTGVALPVQVQHYYTLILFRPLSCIVFPFPKFAFLTLCLSYLNSYIMLEASLFPLKHLLHNKSYHHHCQIHLCYIPWSAPFW